MERTQGGGEGGLTPCLQFMAHWVALLASSSVGLWWLLVSVLSLSGEDRATEEAMTYAGTFKQVARQVTSDSWHWFRQLTISSL